MCAAGVRERLDQLLVKRGLLASRSRARDLVQRGRVLVDGHVAAKPGQLVAAASDLRLVDDEDAKWVSRGALKLLSALDDFGFDCQDAKGLDVGASTGGFTQVLLERGAADVVAVDVGHGQLHAAIAADPRVRSLENTDARRLAAEQLAAPDRTAIVCDVSFISLTKVLPEVMQLGAPGAWLVALVKPQFEVGRDLVGRGGIVRSQTARDEAVAGVSAVIGRQPAWRVVGQVASAVAGADGNQEYLIGAVKEAVGQDG